MGLFQLPLIVPRRHDQRLAVFWFGAVFVLVARLPTITTVIAKFLIAFTSLTLRKLPTSTTQNHHYSSFCLPTV